MDLHSGLPYWIIKNPLFDYYNPLKKNLETDIVIIGSGITGALMAHELCRAGLNCCVVDKRSIATGSSAASTALLQYEIDVPLCQMAEQIGEKNAVTAYQSCLQSISDIEAVLKETDIDADFERLPSLFYASDEKGVKLIEREYEIRKRHGLPVEPLNKEELHKRYKLETYAGALLNRQSAQLDAYKTAIKLFRYHRKKDHLQIYTHTEVVSCEETPQGCRLETKEGRTIRCKYAIVATGFEAGRFLPKKVMKLTSTYALISHPIDNKDLWPERSLIWETAEPYIYVRTSGNRIIIGGEDENFNDPKARDELLREKTEKLEKKFHKILPTVPIKTEMTWCGTFSTTKDGLPFIGTWPGTERLFFDLGYGGNGITFSMIGAQIICNLLQGKEDERKDVFGFRRIRNTL